MNRQIEFRGKTNSDEWVIGSLVHSENIQPAIYFEVGKGSVKNLDWAYVLPETVGQYGNRKTDKGRKIYEGDICFSENELDTGDERLYCVFTFVDEWNMFAWLSIDEYNGYKKEGVKYLAQDDWYSSDMERLHYAGNIWDNPELLNKN